MTLLLGFRSNSDRGIETLGTLGGSLRNNRLVISHLVIPRYNCCSGGLLIYIDISGRLENLTLARWRGLKMCGMCMIERILFSLDGSILILSTTCSFPGVINVQYTCQEVLAFFSDCSYPVWTCTTSMSGSICSQKLWPLSAGAAIAKIFVVFHECFTLVLSFMSSIKFDKTGFLSLTEAGLQEIGRCDQVSQFYSPLCCLLSNMC